MATKGKRNSTAIVNAINSYMPLDNRYMPLDDRRFQKSLKENLNKVGLKEEFLSRYFNEGSSAGLEPSFYKNGFSESDIDALNTGQFKRIMEEQVRVDKVDRENYKGYDGPFRSYKDRLEKASLRSFRGDLAKSLIQHDNSTYFQSKEEKPQGLVSPYMTKENRQWPKINFKLDKVNIENEEKNFMDKLSDNVQTDGILGTIGGALGEGAHSMLDILIGKERGGGEVTGEGSLGAMPDFSNFRAASDSFLGRKLSDIEYDELTRAIKAESSNDPDSYALIGGTILNRLKTDGIDKTTVGNILRKRNQFASVTGTDDFPGPHENFKSEATKNQLNTLESARNLLGFVPDKQENFTAFNKKAYKEGAGTNTAFRDQQLALPDMEVIADSIFSHGKIYNANKAAGGSRLPSTRVQTEDEVNAEAGLLGRIGGQMTDGLRYLFGKDFGKEPIRNVPSNPPGEGKVEPTVVIGGKDVPVEKKVATDDVTTNPVATDDVETDNKIINEYILGILNKKFDLATYKVPDNYTMATDYLKQQRTLKGYNYYADTYGVGAKQKKVDQILDSRKENWVQKWFENNNYIKKGD